MSNTEYVMSKYKGVITTNMMIDDDIPLSEQTDNLESFAKFLLKIDSRTRIKGVHKNSITPIKWYRPHYDELFRIERGWNKMSDWQKFEIVLGRFGLNDALDDWLCVLPTVEGAFRRLRDTPIDIIMSFVED